jgi:pimeloyl-ACP methyl ester carboxylesterase
MRFTLNPIPTPNPSPLGRGVGVLLAGVFIMLSALIAPATAHAQAGVSFTPASCEEFAGSGPVPTEFDENTECGWLTVPAQHSDPAGPTLELGVVILRANGESPQRDPLVMAQGGPGGSTIDSYASLMQGNILRRDRDIVLFDQRGTEHTRPALQCEELNQLSIDTAEQNLSYEEIDRLSMEAAQACRDRLAREGADLSAFDSVENAADVNALREALGYDQINFYGVSYGTLLGQHLLRDFPQILRSAVLDAVAPAEGSFINESGQTENRALTELFTACKADATCDAAYPNLEQRYFEMVDRLNAQPARAPIFDRESGITYNSFLDGDSVQSVVFQSLYGTELLPFLPYVMDRAIRGDYGPLSNVASLFAFDTSVATGMYFSVMCAEDGSLPPEPADNAGIRPEVAERNTRDQASFEALCKLWNVQPLPDEVNAPVQSDVPALMLSGNFDPITPPANGEAVAAALRNSVAFTFPNTGHGALNSEACALNITRQFLDDPTTRPDASCIESLRAPAFVPASSVLPVSSLFRVLSLTEQARNELLTFGLGLLALLSAFLMLPLVWLVRKLANRASGPLPALAKWAPWLILLNGIVLALFFAAMAGYAIGSSGDGDVTFLFGMPASMRLWFVLPVLSIVLTVLIFAGVIAGWRSGWGWVRRILYPLYGVAGVVCLVVLGAWGMLVRPLFG